MIEAPVALIVEDDLGNRMFASDVLENHGFTVLAAASADEGLAILQHRHDVQVILTDVVVPGTLDGLGLVSELRRHWPHKRVIVTSGFMPAEAIALGENTVFLPKPYDESSLIAALAEARASHA